MVAGTSAAASATETEVATAAAAAGVPRSAVPVRCVSTAICGGRRERQRGHEHGQLTCPGFTAAPVAPHSFSCCICSRYSLPRRMRCEV